MTEKPQPFRPVVRGPQRGAPPSLEHVAIERLEVDADYQRTTDGPHSRKIIIGMVKEWNWALCQPLVISRRDDGSLWVLDGQHRVEGARQRGDVAHLPCVILPALAKEDEARAFVDLNTRRQRLSQTDIFNGMLAAGDVDAKAVAGIITETGWRIIRGKANGKWSPGVLNCAPRLVRIYRAHGADVLRGVLSTIREAWPAQAVESPVRLMEGLVEIYRAGGAMSLGERDRVVRALASAEPKAWAAIAFGYRTDHPELTEVQSFAAVIANLAQSPACEPPPPPRPQKAAARPTAATPDFVASAFGDDGKRWCDQCDCRVSAGVIASCKSPFCGLKDVA